MSDKKVFEVEGIGLTSCDDYCRLILDNERCGYTISSLFQKVGVEYIDNYVAFCYESNDWTNLSTPELEKLKQNEYCADYVLEYRASTGNKYPPVYKVKVVVEAQPLTEEDAEKFWKAKQKR